MRKLQTITVGDVLDAMEKNGYEQIRESYVQRTPRYFFGIRAGTKISACAVGQAALNLGVDPSHLGMRLMGVASPTKNTIDLWADIVNRNDNQNLTVQEIARELRIEYSDRLDEKVDI